MAQAILKGARLAYVVQPIEGTVKRPVTSYSKKVGFKTQMVEQPAGFLVYFPRGHVIRVKDRETLTHYNLNEQPQIIQMEGLHDPRSPLGKLFLSQDADSRIKAMEELEQQVIRLAEAKAGPVTIHYNPEDLAHKAKSGMVVRQPVPE